MNHQTLPSFRPMPFRFTSSSWLRAWRGMRWSMMMHVPENWRLKQSEIRKLCMPHLPLHLDCYVHLPRRLVSCAQTILSHDSAWSKAMQHQKGSTCSPIPALCDFCSKGHQPFATGRSPYSCKKKLDQLWHCVSQESCGFRELVLSIGWFQPHPASSEVLFGLNLADMSPLLSWNWDSPGDTAVFPLFQEIGTMNIYELFSIIWWIFQNYDEQVSKGACIPRELKASIHFIAPWGGDLRIDIDLSKHQVSLMKWTSNVTFTFLEPLQVQPATGKWMVPSSECSRSFRNTEDTRGWRIHHARGLRSSPQGNWHWLKTQSSNKYILAST